MKLFKQALLTSALVMILSVSQAQQSTSFTQYHDNQVPFNSAYSLLDKAGSVNLNSRRQWAGIEGAPYTFQLNGSLPIEKINGAAGLSLTYDKFNIEKLAEVSAFFAKAVQLSDQNFFAASFNAGFRNYIASYSEVDPNDVSFRNDIRETVGTVGLGVMLYSPEKYYIGASLPRLSFRSLGNASADEKRNYSNTYYFSGAYLFNLNEDVKFKPATMVSYSRTYNTEADFSATVYLKDKFGFGVNYKTTSEVAGIISVILNTNVKLGYSYQTGFGNANLGKISKGSHEISVGIRFGKGPLQPKLL
ncbi:PorP/SprF family type IX secretion system membrane protein [Pedobacter cryoconitis]|uniref:Type IX secretion system PorP/SprF family membrane protein n=1 Tax=Pedobacter cryoconitis TaxID=188932 RepID=A0A327T5Y0_9SPHI|nr:PorP/SprF family type IX secretion system membrane protein [Pedobacter cryoconitis]RAJ36970.1 type IX secretion system PorP/SprF family membrane protein [Pedobacter cryoconitis]